MYVIHMYVSLLGLDSKFVRLWTANHCQTRLLKIFLKSVVSCYGLGEVPVYHSNATSVYQYCCSDVSAKYTETSVSFTELQCGILVFAKLHLCCYYPKIGVTALCSEQVCSEHNTDTPICLE